ncbi:sensor histidine kinase [Pedobacter sp. AW1-32]|uniref:sensor histidine kinase n=1 Tax=Pedobacter sp. AW1-32 TaxID=3383026 RepID=UPI003FEFD1BE
MEYTSYKTEQLQTKGINQLEFWISTIIYIFALISVCTQTAYGSVNSYFFNESQISYSVIANYFLPNLFKISVVYASFLLINFCFMPQIIKKRYLTMNVLLTGIITFVSILVWMIANTYSEAYRLLRYSDLQEAYDTFFGEAFVYITFLYIIFNVYAYFNEQGIHLLSKIPFLKSDRFNVGDELFSVIRIWLISIMIVGVVLSARLDYDIFIFWIISPPVNIGLAFLSIYYVIPNLRKNFKGFGRYFWGNTLISILISLLLLLFLLAFMRNGNAIPLILIFNAIALVCVTTPLSWYIYKHKFEKLSEIQMLKSELGKSDANLSFLKSQINPHFLFNALNTLFGTALQENAERTGEGIQKLGDMMRFMLHENTLDKISLTREVEYLNNYIDLQKLRTSRSADIRIETQIEEQLNNLQITPMLLIPFIENAFKHGISLQQPSHIKITLQTKAKTLFFDVNNSIYIKSDNDPEKLKSGIGLENVKQRLSLLYYGKHELIIRESANEFFVHLTLQLD